MANYAVGNTRVDVNPFRDLMQTWDTPENYGLPRVAFNQNPGALYTQYLNSLGNLSPNFRRMIQGMFNDLWSQYEGTIAGGPAEGQGYEFMDYLQNYDINRNLSRMAPSMRGEDDSRYVGRSRWVTF